jgi:hypothetical protein
MPRGTIGRLRLYPGENVSRLDSSLVRLGKAARLIESLELTEPELRYAFERTSPFAGPDLSTLPGDASEARDPAAATFFAGLVRLAEYVRLRREIGCGGPAGLLEKASRCWTAADAAPKQKALTEFVDLFASLVFRKVVVVTQALEALGFVAEGETTIARDILQEQGVRRIWEVLRIAEATGLSVADRSCCHLEPLRHARGLPRCAGPTTNGSGNSCAEIFDKLWQTEDARRQHSEPEGLISVDQPFELFLIDSGMEPVVRTIAWRFRLCRHLSAMLANLETVHQSATGRSRAWMKRYRVWQANREIFAPAFL